MSLDKIIDEEFWEWQGKNPSTRQEAFGVGYEKGYARAKIDANIYPTNSYETLVYRINQVKTWWKEVKQ